MMPGSSLFCEPDRDRADVGVSTAPAETALLAAGGPLCEKLDAIDNGLMSSGVKTAGPGPILCLIVGIKLGGSGVTGICWSDSRLLLPKAASPNLRSRQAPRPPAPGGGGKD